MYGSWTILKFWNDVYPSILFTRSFLLVFLSSEGIYSSETKISSPWKVWVSHITFTEGRQFGVEGKLLKQQQQKTEDTNCYIWKGCILRALPWQRSLLGNSNRRLWHSMTHSVPTRYSIHEAIRKGGNYLQAMLFQCLKVLLFFSCALR